MATTLREIAGANRVVLEIGSIPTAARLPDGGDEDQVLSKRSSRSLDVHWTPPVRLDVSSATVQQAISDLASRYSVSDIQGLTLDQRIIRFSWTDGNNRPRSTQIVVPAAAIDDDSILPSQLKAGTEEQKEAFRTRLEVPSDAELATETTERTQGDAALGTRIDTEITDRTEADTALGTSVNQVATDLASEMTNRTQGDNDLAQSLTNLGATVALLPTASQLRQETAARTSGDTALGTRIDTETSARTAADTALGTRIDGIRQYPQSDANKLAEIDIRDVTGITLSGRALTLTWVDDSGVDQTSQVTLPATTSQVAASLSLTPVGSQTALDSLSTTGIAMAVTTVAFGSYSAQDFLVYDHGQSQWEKVGTFGTTLSDDSIEPGWLKADSATEKTAMRTRIAAASSADATALGNRIATNATAIAGKAEQTVVTGIDGRLTTAETKLAGVASGAEVNVNADWDAASGDAQILNKPTIPGNTEIDARIQLPARIGNTSRWDKNKLPTDTVYGTIPAAQVPADWDATTGVSRILNKPTIPAAQVPADWDATTGATRILNKPAIPDRPELYHTENASGVNPQGLSRGDLLEIRADIDLGTGSVEDLGTNTTTNKLLQGDILFDRGALGFKLVSRKPPAQVPSDWDATTGVARILNKPTLVTAWTGLSDTPSALTGQGGKHVAVNSAGNALEFVDAPAGGGSGVDYIRVEGLSVAPGNAQLDLNWTANASASSYETRHKLTSATTWSAWTDRGNVTAYSITGLTNGSQYDVEIRGVELTIASGMGTPTANPTATVSSWRYRRTSQSGYFDSDLSVSDSNFSDVELPQSWFRETLSADERTLSDILRMRGRGTSSFSAYGDVQIRFKSRFATTKTFVSGKTWSVKFTDSSNNSWTLSGTTTNLNATVNRDQLFMYDVRDIVASVVRGITSNRTNVPFTVEFQLIDA